ncbi:SCO3242 family prenyltransferase [Streptomyces sp. NBC_01363]|uniref:SCO3242 family prenyltransferase n=1 Tax=Streptomyces sp. NBC_01363 TaxID=2903840 RepID=UPI002251A404|nr:UbiA family prenyltransferase [Streptomyces sp. NBC_01363]MCX4733325.1 UbiA family prenyltransferase [Streptomyces sp. NBC_01363]
MPGALYELVRAPAALTVPGDTLAGAAAARIPLRPAAAGLAAASVCLYWAGMALNDYADRTVDAYERSHRPIPSGRTGAGTALAVAVCGTAAGLGLAALSGGRRSLAVAVPLAATVWAYDLKLKRGPWGPVAMATARGLDVLLGATAGSGSMARAFGPAATMAAHTAVVTRLSRDEVYGAKAALPRATLAATAVVCATVVVPPRGRDERSALALRAGLAGWYAYRFGGPQAAAVRQPTAERIRSAVGAGIHSMVPLQAALVARSGAPLPALLLSAALPLARRLSRRVSPT